MKPVRGVILLGVLLAFPFQIQCAPLSEDDNQIKNSAKKLADVNADAETAEKKIIVEIESGILYSIRKFFDVNNPESVFNRAFTYVRNVGEALRKEVDKRLTNINNIIKGWSNEENLDDKVKHRKSGAEIEESK
ncbi:uncharacterized protein LOC143240339 isoform X2 [Tachypleus tridentatus]|uniref:uncharacterized protein LOC143240339 isoform X2 n=1 Tax=Tachypleus tridentatus TaxID=6853 RepID=UPI003FD165A7